MLRGYGTQNHPRGWLRARTKVTDDLPWVANAELNVRMPVKARAWIERIAFHKRRPHGIERGFAGSLGELMSIVDDRAIEMAKGHLATDDPVLRHRHPGGIKGRFQPPMTFLDDADGLRFQQVEAVTHIHDRADHEWFQDMRSAHLPVTLHEPRPRV